MKYTSVLEVYSLEDILEYNDIDTEDCLKFLVEQDFLTLPEPSPLDLDDTPY